MVDVLPLSILLKRSATLYKERLRLFATGALTIAAILTIAQLGLFSHVGAGVESMVSESTIEKMEELSVRVQEGDQEAMEEMTILLEDIVGETQEEQEVFFRSKGLQFLAQLAPGLIVFLLVSAILSVLSCSYYVLVSVEEHDSAGSAFAVLPSIFFPFLGLMLWTMVRTFIWIPFLGMLLVFILAPRFILSPVLLVRDGTGVFESTRESYTRTRGFFWKIVGNMFGMWILVALIAMGLNMFLALFGGQPGPVAAFFGNFINQLLFAFMLLFLTQLSDTIIKYADSSSATHATKGSANKNTSGLRKGKPSQKKKK